MSVSTGIRSTSKGSFVIQITDSAQTYDSAPIRRPDIKKKLVVVGDGGKFESSFELVSVVRQHNN